jgi:polygalacturonase
LNQIVSILLFQKNQKGEWIMENITKRLQQQIDHASKVKGQVITPPGEYIIGAIYLKSNVHFVLSEDTILYGSQELADYPEIDNRVAGIDMKWPSAMINILDATDVTISGKGKIDGQGECWWHKFWGTDGKSGMMAAYAKKGLRWAADYDCKRPRNLLIFQSEHITIKDIHSVESGFWNTQITYSSHVMIDGMTVANSSGPSTDGIDIDSSENVTIQQTRVSCNDDSICIKAGRGTEAYMNKTVCRNITIRDCHLGKGSGIAIGSETSGGIEDISISRITFQQTGAGFRIKSASNRGGYIRNVAISDLNMVNVQFPFLLQTNWYPEYSYPVIPKDYQGNVPVYWKKLQDKDFQDAGPAKVENVVIENVLATGDGSVRSRAFFIEGNKNVPIKNLHFSNVSLQAVEYGKIAGVENISFAEVLVTALEETCKQNDRYER